MRLEPQMLHVQVYHYSCPRVVAIPFAAVESVCAVIPSCTFSSNTHVQQLCIDPGCVYDSFGSGVKAHLATRQCDAGLRRRPLPARVSKAPPLLHWPTSAWFYNRSSRSLPMQWVCPNISRDSHFITTRPLSIKYLPSHFAFSLSSVVGVGFARHASSIADAIS